MKRVLVCRELYYNHINRDSQDIQDPRVVKLLDPPKRPLDLRNIRNIFLQLLDQLLHRDDRVPACGAQEEDGEEGWGSCWICWRTSGGREEENIVCQSVHQRQLYYLRGEEQDFQPLL